MKIFKIKLIYLKRIPTRFSEKFLFFETFSNEAFRVVECPRREMLALPNRIVADENCTVFSEKRKESYY